jgi:hypothetical protein
MKNIKDDEKEKEISNKQNEFPNIIPAKEFVERKNIFFNLNLKFCVILLMTSFVIFNFTMFFKNIEPKFDEKSMTEIDDEVNFFNF